MKIMNTSVWRRIYSIKLSESGNQKIFVDLLEKYLGMNLGLWSNVYVWF